MTTSPVKTIEEEVLESIPHYSSSLVPLTEALGLPSDMKVCDMPIRVAVTLQGGLRVTELRK